MQTRKIALCAVLIGAACSGTFVLGQQNIGAQGEAAEFRDLYMKAKDDTSAITPLFDAYKRLPGNAIVTTQAARNGWVDAQKGDNSSLLVIQVMQNQKMIEQNQKLTEQNAHIIELLEKSAKKN